MNLGHRTWTSRPSRRSIATTTRIILLLIAELTTGGARAEEAAKPSSFDASKYPAEVRR